MEATFARKTIEKIQSIQEKKEEKNAENCSSKKSFQEKITATCYKTLHRVQFYTYLLFTPICLDKYGFWTYNKTKEKLPCLLSMVDTKSSESNKEKRLKGERLEARLTSEQKELLQRAAQLEGTTLTDFVVRTTLSQARRVIEEHTLIKLSLEDSQAFARALLNPSEPNAKMMAAAKEYKHSMGLE